VKGGNKPGGFLYRTRSRGQNRQGKKRRELVNRAAQNSRVGYGTNGALVAGPLGVVRVNVNRLSEPGENDQQNAQQRHQSYMRFSRGFVFSDSRTHESTPM